jgi:DnaJ-class molecular chaperone
MSSINSPWDLLGITPYASVGEIKKAYVAKKYLHANNEHLLAKVEKAYSQVSASAKRTPMQAPMIKEDVGPPMTARALVQAPIGAAGARPSGKPQRTKPKYVGATLEGGDGDGDGEVIRFKDNPLFTSPFIEKFFNEGQFTHTYRIPGQDIKEPVVITLDEAYTGLTKSVAFDISHPCHRCAETCDRCEGLGRMPMYKIISGMKQRFDVACQECRTRGYQVRPNAACGFCEGAGHRLERRHTKWNLHPGVDSGLTLVLHGLGEQLVENRCPPGNRVFVLEVSMPTPHYTRVGDHLRVKLPMSFVQSITGARYEVRFPSGALVSIDTRTDLGGQPVHPLTMHRCAGQGMPAWNAEEGRVAGYGDAVVHFEIQYEAVRADIDADDIAAFAAAYKRLLITSP